MRDQWLRGLDIASLNKGFGKNTSQLSYNVEDENGLRFDNESVET